jgi:hypothetical protein
MANDGVYSRVSGLKEIRRDLISADKRYGPEIRKVLKATAQIVVTDAQSRVPVRSGRAKKSIRPATSGASAAIRGGQKTVPYYGWLDFGGRIRPRKIIIDRPVIKSANGLHNGRYIYPAIKAKMPSAVKYLKENIAKLISKGAAE